MESNNNDPIQEKSVFRFGMHQFDGEEENSNRKYDDLHNCSTDLSDKGSRIEELEHRRFAESRRNAYSAYNRPNNNINNKSSKTIAYIILFIFIGLPILQSILGIVIAIIAAFSSGIAEEFKSTPEGDSSYYSDYEEESHISDFEMVQDNILVSGTILNGNRMLINTSNVDSVTITDVQIQVIFYDAENKPIAIEEVRIDTLFGYSLAIKEVYQIPENFERYDFLVTQPYNMERPVVDYRDIQADLIDESYSEINLRITNNTNYKIDSVEIAILYYNGDDLVDCQRDTIYDINSGKSEEETIYLFSEGYTRYEYFVNDVYIYE